MMIDLSSSPLVFFTIRTVEIGGNCFKDLAVRPSPGRHTFVLERTFLHRSPFGAIQTRPIKQKPQKYLLQSIRWSVEGAVINRAKRAATQAKESEGTAACVQCTVVATRDYCKKGLMNGLSAYNFSFHKLNKRSTAADATALYSHKTPIVAVAVNTAATAAALPSRKMMASRWGDSSDDEVDVVEEHPAVHSGLNDGTIPEAAKQMMQPIPQEQPAVVPKSRFAVPDDDEEEEDDDKEREGDYISEVDEEDTEDAESAADQQLRLEEARKKAQEKEKKKQEQSASLEDQLDDLDGILNEMGIDAATEAATATPTNGSAPVAVPAAASSSAAAKRRKKKKKKAAAAAASDAVSVATACSDEEGPATTATGEVDVAAVLKAKAKKKTKTPAQIAAAAAAKEIGKSKKDIAAPKKKKKGLNSVQFGR